MSNFIYIDGFDSEMMWPAPTSFYVDHNIKVFYKGSIPTFGMNPTNRGQATFLFKLPENVDFDLDEFYRVINHSYFTNMMCSTVLHIPFISEVNSTIKIIIDEKSGGCIGILNVYPDMTPMELEPSVDKVDCQIDDFSHLSEEIGLDTISSIKISNIYSLPYTVARVIISITPLEGQLNLNYPNLILLHDKLILPIINALQESQIIKTHDFLDEKDNVLARLDPYFYTHIITAILPFKSNIGFNFGGDGITTNFIFTLVPEHLMGFRISTISNTHIEISHSQMFNYMADYNQELFELCMTKVHTKLFSKYDLIYVPGDLVSASDTIKGIEKYRRFEMTTSHYVRIMKGNPANERAPFVDTKPYRMDNGIVLFMLENPISIATGINKSRKLHAFIVVNHQMTNLTLFEEYQKINSLLSKINDHSKHFELIYPYSVQNHITYYALITKTESDKGFGLWKKKWIENIASIFRYVSENDLYEHYRALMETDKDEV